MRYPGYSSTYINTGTYRTDEKHLIIQPRKEAVWLNYPIILCHGLLADAAYWADSSNVGHMFRGLSEQGFSVFAPDLGGVVSWNNDEAIQAAYDGIEYLRHGNHNMDINTSRFFLMGVSAGASLASIIAARNPEIVAGLALVVPAVMLDALHDVNQSGLGDSIDTAFGGTASWEALKHSRDPYLNMDTLRELGDGGKISVFYASDDEVIPPEYVTPFISLVNAQAYDYRGGHAFMENKLNTKFPHDLATWLSKRRTHSISDSQPYVKLVNWTEASPAVSFPDVSVGLPANDWSQFIQQPISTDGTPANTYNLTLDTTNPRVGRITTATGSKGNERSWYLYDSLLLRDSFLRTSMHFISGSPQLGIVLRARRRTDGRYHGFITWSDALFQLPWIINYGIWVQEATPGGGVELRASNQNFGKVVAEPIEFTDSSRTSNVATLTVPTGHGILLGQLIRIDHDSDTSYNAENISVSAVTATSVSYSNTGANDSNSGAGEVRNLAAVAAYNIEARVIGMTLQVKVWGMASEVPTWSNNEHVATWVANQESPSLAGDLGPREAGYAGLVAAHMPTGDVGGYGPTTLGAA